MGLVDPLYLIFARKYVGLREVPGAGNNPTIVNWLIQLKAWWRDDLEPWCGTFVAACLRDANLPIPKAWYRAKAYLDYGTPIAAPIYGCIIVFTREGGGHVGFVVGRDKRGRLLVLGGNQRDSVSIAPFEMARVAGYRMPPGMPTAYRELPILTYVGEASTNEA
jgi:uncharacterized protein (TIGR02594 family)